MQNLAYEVLVPVREMFIHPSAQKKKKSVSINISNSRNSTLYVQQHFESVTWPLLPAEMNITRIKKKNLSMLRVQYFWYITVYRNLSADFVVPVIVENTKMILNPDFKGMLCSR